MYLTNEKAFSLKTSKSFLLDEFQEVGPAKKRSVKFFPRFDSTISAIYFDKMNRLIEIYKYL